MKGEKAIWERTQECIWYEKQKETICGVEGDQQEVEEVEGNTELGDK